MPSKKQRPPSVPTEPAFLVLDHGGNHLAAEALVGPVAADREVALHLGREGKGQQQAEQPEGSG